MARAIVNKLMHAPTERLKRAAAHGDRALPGVAADLFGIDDENGASEEQAGSDAAMLSERKA